MRCSGSRAGSRLSGTHSIRDAESRIRPTKNSFEGGARESSRPKPWIQAPSQLIELRSSRQRHTRPRSPSRAPSTAADQALLEVGEHRLAS